MSVEVINLLNMNPSLVQSSDSEATSASRIKLLKAAFEQGKIAKLTQPPPSITKENNYNPQSKSSPKNGLLNQKVTPAERKCLTLDVQKTKQVNLSPDPASKRITWCGAESVDSTNVSPTPVPVPRFKSPKSNGTPSSCNVNTKEVKTPSSSPCVESSPHESSSPSSPSWNRLKPKVERPAGSDKKSLLNESHENRPPPRPSTPPMRKSSNGKPKIGSKPPLTKTVTKPSPPPKSIELTQKLNLNVQEGSEWKRVVGPPAKPVPPSPRIIPRDDINKDISTSPDHDGTVNVTMATDSGIDSPKRQGSDKRRPPPRPKVTHAESAKLVKPPVPPTLRPCQSVPVISSVSPTVRRQKAISRKVDRNQKPKPQSRHISVDIDITDKPKTLTDGSPLPSGRVSPLESFDTTVHVTSIDDFMNSVKRKYKQCNSEKIDNNDTINNNNNDYDYATIDDEPIDVAVNMNARTSIDSIYEPINGRHRSNTSTSHGIDNDYDSDDSSYWTVDEAVASQSPQVTTNTTKDDQDEIPPLPPQRKSSLHKDKRRLSVVTVDDDSDQSSSEDSDYEKPGLVKRGSTLGVCTPEAYMALSEISEEDSPTHGCYDVELMQQAQGMGTVESNEATEDYTDEPLYQLYAADVLSEERKRSQKSIEEESMLSDYSEGSGQRILWCQLQSVRISGLLDNLDPQKRKRQEAMFEVITSEASYLKSLNVLVNHFMMAPEFVPNTSVQPEEQVLDKQQFHFLFTGVTAVKSISERFLHDLRVRQEDDVVISSISDIILEYASKYFSCYIKYCSNQIYQDRTLLTIVQENPRFCEVLGRLESSTKCQGLSMQSFMMLPMQRITRMPLLVDAICSHCELGSDEFAITDRALRAVNKVVRDCNEGARRMERTEQMYFIQQAISFKTKPIPLISTSRWLLRRGQLSCIQEDIKTGKHRRPLRQLLKGRPKPIYIFLFTDLLLLAKMKSDDSYKVFDYCTRSMLRVESDIETTQANPDEMAAGGKSPSLGAEKYVFNLILLENSKGKTMDYLCLAQNETEKTRWLEALSPSQVPQQDGETVYSEWDCPQVQAVHAYHSQQPDELNLQEGDVIKVLRKLADGWFEGQRLRDGEEGWFPSNHTEEIISEHVRARNLLQRYRLLNASKVLMGMMQNKES